MKAQFLIAIDMTQEQVTQMLRNGFNVNKQGSKLRLIVGDELIATDRAIITYQEITDDKNTTPK